MVAIVAGNGLGLFNASNNILGGAGIFGSNALGQFGGRGYVNASNGNLLLQSFDEQLSGRGADLVHLRTYNLQGRFDGDGDGWRWDGERTLVLAGSRNSSGSTVTITAGDSSRDVFTWHESSYVSTDGSGAHDTLTFDNASGQWILVDGSTRREERFEQTSGTAARLASRKDIDGNTISFGYDAQGRLTTIIDNSRADGTGTGSNQKIVLTYGTVPNNRNLTRLLKVETFSLTVDGTGRATTTLGSAVQQVSYEYDAFGRLISVTTDLTPSNTADNVAAPGTLYKTKYTYDGTSFRIKSIAQSDGTAAGFVYAGFTYEPDPADPTNELKFRVKTVTDGNGTQTFTYGANSTTVKISDDVAGTVNVRTWIYTYDSEKRLSRVDSPPPTQATAPLVTRFEYNANGDVTKVTDARGNAVEYQYDAAGNCTLERDAVFGNTIARTFDAATNQLLTETRYRVEDADGSGPEQPREPLTTRYVYDSQSRLRFVISPEGRVIENRYFASGGAQFGLLDRTLRYTADRYDVGALTPTQAPSLSEMVSWVGSAHISQAELQRYTYDLRGNVSDRVDFAAVDSNGNGVRNGKEITTTYIYSGHGELLQIIALHERGTTLTSMVYDGMGRVIETVNSKGRETTVYDDVNRKITVTAEGTDPDLLTISNYDTAGRLISVSQSTGDASRQGPQYLYDAQGRLRMVQDSSGARHFSFYDDVGRLTFSVDSTGAVCQYIYDENGHIVTQTHFNNRVTQSAMIGWVDIANGTVIGVKKTTFVVAAATGSGVDLVTDSAHDRTTSYHYDAVGRLDQQTDAANVITNIAYDGASRVIARYSNDRRTSYFYDRDGNQVGKLDALGYLTESRFDGAGRLIEAIQYTHLSPALPDELDPEDPLADLRPSDPEALHSYRYYDGVGRLAGQVDTRGFLTEIVYDTQANKQQDIKYLDSVTVVSGGDHPDTLATLRDKAGARKQASTTEFDGLGRVSRIVGVDGTVTRNEYDSAGRLTRQVRAEGTGDERGNRIRYNAFGEVIGTVGGVGDAAVSNTDDAIAQYGMRYTYDSLGRRVKSIDANGHEVRYFYDREGRQTHTVRVVDDPENAGKLAGEVSETKYNAFGQAESTRRYGTRLSDSALKTLAGGDNTALVSSLAPLANATNDAVESFKYDKRGLLESSTDAKGFVTSNTYTDFGELRTQIRTILQAAADGTPVKTTTTQFDYDLVGQLISQTADRGGINFTTHTEYDAYGRVISSTDAAGKITQTNYRDSGRTIEVVDALDRATRTNYDAFNRLLTVTDALGNVTRYSYDDVNRTHSVTTPENITITTVMTRNGQTLRLIDGRGNATEYEYNRDGQVLTADKTGNAAHYEYDKSGRLLHIIDALGVTTTLSYDALNRVVTRQVDPDGLNLTTQYRFDALGRQTDVIEAAGTSAQRVTHYVYDLSGRLTQVLVDPDGLKLQTTYEYDGLGNTIRVDQGTPVNKSQQVTLYQFDNLGRRTKQIAAPSSVFGSGAAGTRDITTQYRYDSAGRLSRSIDALGQSTWFVYDDAGQLTYTINALGEVSRNFYDANGRLAQTRRYITALDKGTVSQFGDTASGFTVTSTLVDQRSFFVYDADGRRRFTLQAAMNPADSNLGFSGEPSEVAAGDHGQWLVSENRYDANGNVIESRRYDQALNDTQLGALVEGGVSAVRLEDLAAKLREIGYQETALGSTSTDASKLAQIQRTRFAYDRFNRLRFSVDALGSVSESVYDAGGRVITTVRYAARPTLPVGVLDETSINNAVNSETVNRGNPDNQVSHFVYDAAGRLRFTAQVLVGDEGGSAAEFIVSEKVFDALGRVTQTTAYGTVMQAFIDADFTLDILSRQVSHDPNKDRSVAFVYDAAGRQIYSAQVQNPDEQGRPLHIVTKMSYDALGHVVQSTTHFTALLLADYRKETIDAALAPAAVANHALNRTTRYVYDKAGRQHFVVAADGSFKETVYDALGQATERRQFAFGVEASFDVFSPTAEQTLIGFRGTHVVGDGATRGEKYTYDAAGRLLTTTDAADAKGNTERNEYDALGNRHFYFDKMGNRWVYTYDLAGHLRVQTSPFVSVQLSGEDAPQELKLRTEWDYDAFGNLTRFVEGSGTHDSGFVTHDVRVTRYEYDRLGRQTRVILPGVYNPTSGQVERGSDEEVERANIPGDRRFQRTRETTYDALGNAVRTAVRTDRNSFLYEYSTFDSLGRVKHNVDASNHVTAFTYTVLGEQETVTRHSATIAGAPVNGTAWSAGEIDAQVTGDAAARTMTMRYDNMGHKVEVMQPQTASDVQVTRYDYNAFGEIFHESVKVGSASAPQWRDTWHYFDAMGRETRTIDAVGCHTERTYDKLGNLTDVIEYARAGVTGINGGVPPALPVQDTKDRITRFVYNALNQQTSVQRFGLSYSFWDGTRYVDVNNARDAATTILSMEYDKVGRMTTRTDGLNNVTRTEYDALGHVVKVVEPLRATVGFSFLPSVDPFKFASSGTSRPETTYVLNIFGQVVMQQRGPGKLGMGETLITRQEYDFAGNLVKVVDAKGSEKLLQNDYAGRVIKETRAINVSLGPLGNMTHTLERRYAYDDLGRQIATLDVYMDGATALQSGQRSVFNAFGEVEEEQRVWGLSSTALDSLNHAKVATYSYDNAGHVTTKRAGDGETRYFYDLAGQMTRQEQRGDNTSAARVTRIEYNLRGDAVTQWLPAFDAAFEFNGTEGMSTLRVVPITEQAYDRWGNVISRSQGGYLDVQEDVINTDRRTTVRYVYNHDNQVIAEIAPTVQTIRQDGSAYFASTTHELGYDLLGRPVLERDLADDFLTSLDDRMLLRERRKEYNQVGQLTADVDSTGIRTEYIYDANGNRVGTKNNLGTVFVDTFDANGNIVSHGVLRLSLADDSPPYISGVTQQEPVVRVLNMYEYDQANRRIASGDVMNVSSVIVHWSYTKFDERNLARVQRNASGVETTSEYNQFGNKTREQIGSASLGNVQTWTYSAADDYSVGRLLIMTAGSNNNTTYGYDGFGQLRFEIYAGGKADRGYFYHDNGLIARIEDRSVRGTAGPVGGVDFLDTTEITSYDYDTKGQLVSDRFTRTGRKDVKVDLEGPPVIETQALVPFIRNVFTRYDALGRVTRVWAPGGDNFNNGIRLNSLDYSYDELSNVRHILGPGTNSWFTYDGEGRMRVADGLLDNGTIFGGTKIDYDGLGRRSQTERSYKSASWSDPNTIGRPEEIIFSWNEYRLERYEYDDLSHLQFISQMIDFRDAFELSISNGVLSPGSHDGDTGWHLLEERRTDVRGAVIHRDNYTTLETEDHTFQGWHGGARTYFTDSTYRADGQLLSQQTLKVGEPEFNEALTGFEYNDDGTLRKYVYINGVGPRANVDTYTYTYGMEFGGMKEHAIDVSRVAHEQAPQGAKPGSTDNFYDARGRLERTVISNEQRTVTRTFTSDNQGRVLETLEIVKIPRSIDEGGRQTHFYANGRQVGTIGSGTLGGTRFSLAYTPITSDLSNPGNYVVRSGDTLSSIALAVYGDAALWYLIADANSIGLGPDEELSGTEIGKTYRIPDVVNGHNNASTFKPYSPADIIGNTTPSPALPIPPEQCSGVGRVVATAVVIAVTMVVQYGVSYVATPYIGPMAAGSLGAAAGNLAGQTTGWGLGLQDGIKWGEVGEAAIAGFYSGAAARAVPSSTLSGLVARQAATSVGAQVAHVMVNQSNQPSDFSIGGTFFQMGTQVGAAALGSKLSINDFQFAGATGQLANDAFNPQSGWLFNARSRDWSSIATQAVGASTSVAVNAGIDWMRTQPSKNLGNFGLRNVYRRNLPGFEGTLIPPQAMAEQRRTERQAMRIAEVPRPIILADAYDSSTAQATSDEGFAPWDNPFMPLPAAPVSVFSLPIPEAAESPALPTPVSEPSPISELPESPPALRSEIDYSELVSRAPEPQPIRSEADPAVIEQWARDLAEPEAAASAQAADSEPIEREQGSAPSYRVRIVAHASPRWQGARGAADADSRNLELSQLRANAVAGEVASLFAAIAGAGRSVSIDTVVAEDDGTVGIATDARGGRDTLLEANGNRLDNAAQRRRVDVTIESGRRVGGLAGLSDTYVTTVPTASTRWNINTEVSAGAQVGVGAGLQTVTLTNELSGQSMSGWIPMFQVGPEASLGASGSIWGGPSQFATDRPVDFSDFHRAFVAASSAGVSGFLGYQGSTISFPGLGTGDIDVSSWSAGSVGVGASAQFGLLLLLGDYPPAEIPVKNPTTYVVPYERTERGQDAHRVLFPTQSATISDTERALLDSLVRSVAERWR